MCKDCGCQSANEKAFFANRDHDHSHDHHEHDHSHDHGHDHDHDHDQDHHHHDGHNHEHDRHVHEHNHKHDHHHSEHNHKQDHHHEKSSTGHHMHDHEHRNIELGQNVLDENDRFAAENRKWLSERGVVALNFISSPGSGKTYLLEKTLAMLQGKISTAVLVGDQQTDLDAKRLSGKGAHVKQINTYSSCHLDAHMIGHELEEIIQPEVELLLIENVGNLVCPAAFDLGEKQKVALLSCTEGEDKPIKYPVLFHDASLIVLTKSDLEEHLEWDRQKCINFIRQVNHRAPILSVSAKTGAGMTEWVEYLINLVRMERSLRK